MLDQFWGVRGFILEAFRHLGASLAPQGAQVDSGPHFIARFVILGALWDALGYPRGAKESPKRTKDYLGGGLG